MKKISSIVLFALTAGFLVFACARNHNGYGGGSVNNPPPPPPPHPPVDIMVSVENSAAMAPYLDRVENGLNSFVSSMQSAGYDFRIGLLRNTENADGNYDSRFVGPQTVVTASDPAPSSEMDQDMKTLRAAFVGSAPRPENIVVQALLDGRNSAFFRPGAIRIHLFFSLGRDYDPAAYYTAALSQLYSPPNWRAVVFSPDSPGPLWGDHSTILDLSMPDYVVPLMSEVSRFY